MTTFKQFLRWLLIEKEEPVEVRREIYDAGEPLTSEEETRFVMFFIERKEPRELLEKFLKWKIGVITGEVMRTNDERISTEGKGAVRKIAEMTHDFKALWMRVQAREAERAAFLEPK